MKIVTAIEVPETAPYPFVFLAGGIQKCPEWQDEVIAMLRDFPHGTLWNPRRKNFPIHDPNAAEEQIAWEFQVLEETDIFTMWFCESESVQPICMYELGRNLARYEAVQNKLRKGNQFGPGEWPQPFRVCIGSNPRYQRWTDVVKQVALVDAGIRISTSLKQHVMQIKNAINEYMEYQNARKVIEGK